MEQPSQEPQDSGAEQHGPVEQPSSPWLDTPESRARDAEAIARLEAEGISPERARAALEAVRDRQRYERAIELGVNAEDATAAIEGDRLLRQARREREARQAETGQFIVDAYERAQQARADFPWFGETPDREPAGEQPDDREGVSAEQAQRVPPRIWIGSLSDYNAGDLHGAWLEAGEPIERLQEAIVAMLARSPTPSAEEWAIFDYDGFGAVTSQLGEYESLERVNRIARGIVEHGEAFAAYVAHIGPLHVDAQSAEQFARRFRGEWESLAAYADHGLRAAGAWDLLRDVASQRVPPALRPYVTFDIERYAADMSEGLHVVSHDHGVWVFDFDNGRGAEEHNNNKQEN